MIVPTNGSALPAVEQGIIIASLLRGAWRRQPGSAPVTLGELRLVAPILVRSGTAALAWRRLRDSPLASTEIGREIHRARLIQAAQAAIHEAQIDQILSHDAIASADPILIKGWAHGALYPEPAVRHYTDIDLLVEPQQVRTVAEAATSAPFSDPARSVPVDVQGTLKDLPERSWGDLVERARRVRVLKSTVRVLGPEDTLRLSCIHMLRHLGFHPLWLCDVGALIENLPSDFDWDYCLSGDRRRTEWMLAVLRLANHVLGANLERCPQRRIPGTTPQWIIRAMLRWWGAEETYIYPWPLPKPVGHARRPSQVLAERWPDPLQAVARFSWPITRLSARPAQLLDFSIRALIWGPRQFGLFPRKQG
jgi:hypothetical protein